MRRIAAGQARLTSPSVIRRHSQVLKEYRLLPLEVDIRAGLARDRHSSATAGSAISAADPQRMILAKEKSAEPGKPALCFEHLTATPFQMRSSDQCRSRVSQCAKVIAPPSDLGACTTEELEEEIRLR